MTFSGGVPERRVRIVFEPRDLWLGVFVDTVKKRVYICLAADRGGAPA